MPFKKSPNIFLNKKYFKNNQTTKLNWIIQTLCKKGKNNYRTFSNGIFVTVTAVIFRSRIKNGRLKKIQNFPSDLRNLSDIVFRNDMKQGT